MLFMKFKVAFTVLFYYKAVFLSSVPFFNKDKNWQTI